jgi:hypothetical protein
MAMIAHNLPSSVLKNDSGEVDEALIQGIEKPGEIIICILGIEKSYFYEVA